MRKPSTRRCVLLIWSATPSSSPNMDSSAPSHRIAGTRAAMPIQPDVLYEAIARWAPAPRDRAAASVEAQPDIPQNDAEPVRSAAL
jgi:hypothetical protein